MGILKRVFGTSGWDALPSVFVQSLKERIGNDGFYLLDHFAKKYKIFNQKFFNDTERFESEPEHMLGMFSLFIGSMGNQISQKGKIKDAEQLYLISIKLKNEGNPSHGSLAIIYAQTNRIKEAKREAAIALKTIEEIENDPIPVPEEIAPHDGLKNSIDDMREILMSIIKFNDVDYNNDQRRSSSTVTDFKDTTHKGQKVPACWSGIRFTDGSQCQISVAHKVLIYRGKSMIGGKFYEADAHDIRILMSNWLSEDEMWALMKGRIGLLKENRNEFNEILQPPVDGMYHPSLIIYTNLALKCNSVEEFKSLLNQAK
jgi:hypothetical protein